MWLWIELLCYLIWDIRHWTPLSGLVHPRILVGNWSIFSALEPILWLLCFVHVIYDWGKTGIKKVMNSCWKKMNNSCILLGLFANAFGNFLGAGIWGFFHTLPQMNIYTHMHAVYITAAHGHLVLWSTFATINWLMFYLGVQSTNGIKVMKTLFASKWFTLVVLV